jgi:hypothetical protein
MGLQTKSFWTKLEVQSTPAHPVARTSGDPQFEINVIFTTVKGTYAAMKAGQELAQDLDAQILLLVPQVVPIQFPLSNPPVSIAFTVRRAYELALACQNGVDISVQVYLCGDRRACLLAVLKPQSLVIIGGQRRWWPTPDLKLANLFRAKGHRVIFVDGK